MAQSLRMEGSNPVDQNAHRLFEVSRRIFPAALKPVLERALKLDTQFDEGKTFQENLDTVFTKYEMDMEQRSNLSEPEKEVLFPSKGRVGSYSTFDVNIVCKLINYLYSRLRPMDMPESIEHLKKSWIKEVLPDGNDFKENLELLLNREWLVNGGGKKQKSKKIVGLLRRRWLNRDELQMAFKANGEVKPLEDFTCLIMYKLSTYFLPVPNGVTMLNPNTKGLVANPELDEFDFGSANQCHFMGLLREIRHFLCHRPDTIHDCDFQIYWRCITNILERLKYNDLTGFQSIRSMIFTREQTESHLEEARRLRREDNLSLAIAELRKVHRQRCNARELDAQGDPNLGGRTKADLWVSLVTVKAEDADRERVEIISKHPHMDRRTTPSAESIDFRSLLKNEERIVLLRGEPGRGKSTLCQMILSEWLDKNMWEDKYDLVLYVDCPMLVVLANTSPAKLRRRDATPLEKLYPKSFSHWSLDEMIEENIKLLLIVDSIDEVNMQKICANEETLTKGEQAVYDIFHDKRFDKIIAGRPHACESFRAKYLSDFDFQYVEVIGFNEDQAKEYVYKYLGNDKLKATEVWEKMQRSRAVFSMVLIPVFISILCFLFNEDFSYRMPETQTELYVLAYIGFMLRHGRRMKRKSITIKELLKDPQSLSDLHKICKMAYENLQQQKVLFEVSEGFSEETLLSCFLLKRKMFYSFAHMTFMEFFAAIELLRGGESVGNIYKKRQLKGTLPFYAGLCGACLSGSNSPDIIKEFVAPLKSQILMPRHHPISYKLRKKYDLEASDFAMCYEFRNENLMPDMAEIYSRKLPILSHEGFIHHMYFIKHFVKTCIRIMDFHPSDNQVTENECRQLVGIITDQGIDVNKIRLAVLNDACMEILSKVLFRVANVVLVAGERVSKDGWKYLGDQIVKHYRSCNFKLKRLEIFGNHYTTVPLHLSTQSMISQLCPAHCGLDDAGMKHLAVALPLVSEICLDWNQGIKEEGWKSFSEHVTTANAQGNLKLSGIRLRASNLENASMKFLCATFVLIKNVDLSFRECDPKVWKTFSEHIIEAGKQECLKVKTLNLTECDLDDADMKHLSRALPLLSEVKLGPNQSMRAEGWESFSREITSAHERGTLALRKVDLGENRPIALSSLFAAVLLIEEVILHIEDSESLRTLSKNIMEGKERDSLKINSLCLPAYNIQQDSLKTLSTALTLIPEVKLAVSGNASSKDMETLATSIQVAREAGLLETNHLVITPILNRLSPKERKYHYIR